jgi:hypothetical protein
MYHYHRMDNDERGRRIIERHCQRLAEASASVQEALILAGCNRCGAGLLRPNGFPAPGCSLVEYQGREDPAERYEALCGECLRKAGLAV